MARPKTAPVTPPLAYGILTASVAATYRLLPDRVARGEGTRSRSRQQEASPGNSG